MDEDRIGEKKRNKELSSEFRIQELLANRIRIRWESKKKRRKKVERRDSQDFQQKNSSNSWKKLIGLSF